MLTVLGLQATTPGRIKQTAPPLEQRLRASRARARRRWAIRTALALLLGGISLCVLLAWQRDEANVTKLLTRLQTQVAALQARTDQLGLLPYTVPELAGYVYAREVREFAQNTTGPVIIAFNSQPVRLFLQRDGRAVVVIEAGKLRAEWMTENQFQTRWFKQGQEVAEFDRQRHARPPELP